MRKALARFGHWLVTRFDPSYEPPPGLYLPSVHRFQVFTVHYAGESGGDARRGWEALQRNRLIGDSSISYFMDGDECRGRV